MKISVQQKYNENNSRPTQKLYTLFQPGNNNDSSDFKKLNSEKDRQTHHQSFSNNKRGAPYHSSIPTKECTPTDDPT